MEQEKISKGDILIRLSRIESDMNFLKEHIEDLTSNDEDKVSIRETKDEYARYIIETSKKHFQNHGHKKMTLAELDKLCEI